MSLYHILKRYMINCTRNIKKSNLIVFQLGTEHNFRKVTNSLTNGIPYDYYSIMHYGSHDFSRNGRPTIVPWDRSVDTRRMGNVPTFSTRDVQHVNTLYTCQNSREMDICVIYVNVYTLKLPISGLLCLPGSFLMNESNHRVYDLIIGSLDFYYL